ncbi:hypothetical protein KCU99_g2272, partial [Aureobasidium melanogenum]
MTSSPTIGPLIEKVTLSTLRITPDGGTDGLNVFQSSKAMTSKTGIDVYDDLVEVFRNLRSYGNSITIGITDVFDDEV